MFFFQNLTAELFLLESPDDSYFPKSGGSTFLKTVGSHFSEICGNKITAYKWISRCWETPNFIMRLDKIQEQASLCPDNISVSKVEYLCSNAA